MADFHGDNPHQSVATKETGAHDALFTDYLKLARMEFDEQGRPIVITPPTKPMPETLLAKELGKEMKQNGDPSHVLPKTQELLAPYKDPDDVENSLDWLQDKLDDQLEKTPWKVDFGYDRDTDRLQITIINRDDPSKSSTVTEPRKHGELGV